MRPGGVSKASYFGGNALEPTVTRHLPVPRTAPHQISPAATVGTTPALMSGERAARALRFLKIPDGGWTGRPRCG